MGKSVETRSKNRSRRADRKCGGDQSAMAEVIEFDGGLILELETQLAAPLDEGAAGDAQFGGDAHKAPALGATFDEFLTDFR